MQRGLLYVRRRRFGDQMEYYILGPWTIRSNIPFFSHSPRDLLVQNKQRLLYDSDLEGKKGKLHTTRIQGFLLALPLVLSKEALVPFDDLIRDRSASYCAAVLARSFMRRLSRTISLCQ
jgi:hypothetical protein